VSLNTVLENIDTMLRPIIGEDVELAYELEPGLWPVLADISQLEQVILNLSVNARDAMPHGGTLAFGTRNVPAGAPRGDGTSAVDEVILSVRDTGTGMNSEVRSHLFEPFFTTKRPGEGTGLGLATVYGVVDQSNGHIEVESEPGRGTEFRLHFPRQAGPVPREDNAPGKADLPRGTETILLVEDEVPVRALTRALLSEWGYTVREATDPGDALRIAEREGSAIDMLLTDVVMPGMRGSELAARIREICSRAVILFMSGYPDDAGLGLGRRGPGVHFLEKPFTPGGLARKVRETLDEGARP
jgi:CheY-like chemotaxis protein